MTAERRQTPEGGWGELTVDELKSELEARGLPRSGKKDELIARLDEDDLSEAAGVPAAEDSPPSTGAAPPAAPIEEATIEAALETPEPAVSEVAAEPATEDPAVSEVAAEPAPEDGAVSEVAAEPATEDPLSEEAQEASEDAAAAADADEEAADEAGAEDAGEESAAEQAQRRRGSAETSTGAQRRTPAPRPEGDLIVRARAKYVRSAPRKARLVMDHIRGKRVEHAQAILAHAPRAVSADILKLLNSAVANAEDAYELGADELTVWRA